MKLILFAFLRACPPNDETANTWPPTVSCFHIGRNRGCNQQFRCFKPNGGRISGTGISIAFTLKCLLALNVHYLISAILTGLQRLGERWCRGTSEMCENKAEAYAPKLDAECGSLVKAEA